MHPLQLVTICNLHCTSSEIPTDSFATTTSDFEFVYFLHRLIHRDTPTSTLSPFCNEPFEQECQKVGEGVEFAIEADVFVSQLDTVFHIGIFIITQQFVQ